MARNFSSDTDRINFGSSVPELTSAWTVGGWFRRTSSGRATAITALWSRWTSSAANRQLYVYLLPATAGANTDKFQIDVPFVAAILTGSTAVTGTAWHHFAVKRTGNDWTLYLDGVSDGTATVVATQETGAELTFGDTIVTGVGAGDMLGDQAEIAGWDAALGVDEVVALSKGIAPLLIRPTSLVFYAPIIGRASPEPDIVAGTTGTLTGTANAAHTRMAYGGSRRAITTKTVSAAVLRHSRITMPPYPVWIVNS